MITVAAAVIFHDCKLLICQRPQGSHCELLWEFPGGKVESGESPEQCAVRECKEELDLSIQTGQTLLKTTYRYPDREIAFTFLLASLTDKHMIIREHQAVRWIGRTELSQYPFCPADQEIVARISQDWDLLAR